MAETDRATPDSQAQATSGAISEESVLAASTGDLPTEEDDLGFEPYVRALAEFLTNPATRGPLTVSVEGEWGSGKSSFMLQLEQKLIEIAAGAARYRSHRVPLTVRFNAWRHDKDEALWAAFATEFARRVALEQSLPRRWWGHLCLLIRRFQWKDGWIDLLRAIFLWISLFAATTFLFVLAYLKGANAVLDLTNNLSKSKGVDPKTVALLMTWLKNFGWTGVVLGYLAVILAGFVKLKQYIGNPLAVDLKKYLRSPDYVSRISFVEQFHEDFCKIVDAYAGDKTVYVFIDDLDRCDVPKAAELMQALNLMMSSDRRGLIFIIGMDRQKVAAGLAVKNEKLLPYLTANRTATARPNSAVDPELGLEFGYAFIEKFIQIPFFLPTPKPKNVEKFFDEIAKAESASVPRSPFGGLIDQLGRWFAGQQSGILRSLRLKQARAQQKADSSELAADPQSASAPSEAKIEHRERLKLAVTGDSSAVRDIVLAVAPALSNNPRRIKQFLNLFRLRTFIAAETGLFDGEEGITLQQLGKFVAVSLACPLLLADLDRNQHLLRELNRVALRLAPEAALSDAAQHWLANLTLLTLLRSNIHNSNEEFGPWSLGGIDVGRLLRVSPRVRTIDLRTPNPEKEVNRADAPAAPSSGSESGSPNLSSRVQTSPDSTFSSTSVTAVNQGGAEAEWSVVLVAYESDRKEVLDLRDRLKFADITAQVVEGLIVGSRLVKKIDQTSEHPTKIFFCLGSEFAQTFRAQKFPLLEDRIPVILPSVDQEFLIADSGRLYFDLRRAQDFYLMVSYITGATQPSRPNRDVE